MAAHFLPNANCCFDLPLCVRFFQTSLISSYIILKFFHFYKLFLQKIQKIFPGLSLRPQDCPGLPKRL